MAGGFVEVDGERCIVLAEDAMPVDKLDVDKVRQECRDLKEDISDASSDATRLLAQKKLAVAEAKLVTVTGDILPQY